MSTSDAAVTRNVPLIYSPDLMAYDFGPQHPLRPERLRLTLELMSACGLLEDKTLLIPPKPATEHDVLTYHTSDYVSVVKELGCGKQIRESATYGFEWGDNPPFRGMYEASLLYTGASILAGELVTKCQYRCAFNISGGLHHAMANRASGFCVFNDAVILINRLRETFERIAYVDIDAHHGDGVQTAFHRRRDVLTISIHENGHYLFPGSGFVEEIGEGEGRGFSVNIPLMPGTPEDTHVWAFQQIVPPLISAFDPQVIVAQLGTDAHFEDPLAHLSLTSEGFIDLVRTILSFDRPVVALGGGGYKPTNVARLWTLAYAEMRSVELPDNTPGEFADKHGIHILRDRKPPVQDEAGKSARDAVHHVVEDLRRLIFPLHGLVV